MIANLEPLTDLENRRNHYLAIIESVDLMFDIATELKSYQIYDLINRDYNKRLWVNGDRIVAVMDRNSKLVKVSTDFIDPDDIGGHLWDNTSPTAKCLCEYFGARSVKCSPFISFIQMKKERYNLTRVN